MKHCPCCGAAESDWNGAKSDPKWLDQSAEIERLRATPHIPPVWDGKLVIETVVHINGTRYDPGVYQATLQRRNDQ